MKKLWQVDKPASSSPCKEEEHQFTAVRAKEHTHATYAHDDDDQNQKPYSGKTAPRVYLYPIGDDLATDSRAWLRDLHQRTKWCPLLEKHVPDAPTSEQADFIDAVVKRCLAEQAFERTEKSEGLAEEPMLDLIHGLPGTGKSRVIEWTREYFENILGWEHGVQFVCLAYQNSMAAGINGLTINHWAAIPINETNSTVGTKDSNALSTKCQCLRFILIDEISMVSAQMLGQLEYIIARVIRKNMGYKQRQDGSERLFGGVNVLMFGDWWQIKPVGGTALFQNPEEAPNATAHHGMSIFWGEEPNCIHHTWELTIVKRCDDPWLKQVLERCRHGERDDNTYYLLNGFPTKAPHSGTCGDDRCCCVRERRCSLQRKDGYEEAWVRLFLDNGFDGAALLARECAQCTAARKLKRRALYDGDPVAEELRAKPFDTAPGLYLFNVPRYETILLRAREYARANDLPLHWFYAQDVPQHREDRELPEEELRKKRFRWLENHDQKTKHLCSVCPLAKGLPMKLLDNIDRKRHLFRGRKCFVRDWVPHPEAEIGHNDSGDIVYSKMPTVIYVCFFGGNVADTP